MLLNYTYYGLTIFTTKKLADRNNCVEAKYSTIVSNVLKSWLADNVVAIDNKDNKILVWESVGHLTEKEIMERMMKKITGLK